MKWSEKCMMEFTHRKLFENDDHRARFRDLLDCYSNAPFFTKGLCKCMYLGAWDNTHFAQMLDILNETIIEHDDDLELMKDNGIVLENSAEGTGDAASASILALSNDFVNESPYDMAQLDSLEVEEPEAAYIIKRALQAAQCIDDLPPIHTDES